MSQTPQTLLPWSWGLGVGLLAAAWAAGPAWLQGGLVGAPAGEAVAHAWGLSVAAEGLWTHGPFVRVSELVGAPGGWRSDLVDPANTLMFAILPTTAAWTLTLVGWIVAGALGATALGRRLALDRWSSLVLVAAWVLGPALHGSWLPSGRSELWPLLLWPAHLAALHGAVRGRRRDLGLAVVSLAAMAHGGWAPLLLLLPWQVVAGLMWSKDRAGLGRLVAVGAGAAVLCLPMLAVHLSVDPWWLARTSVPSPLDAQPLGTDVSGLLTGVPGPGVGDLGPALAPVLWLAVLGRRRWFVLGAAMLVASAGPAVSLLGQDWWSPWAGVMHVVTPLRGLHGWPRIAQLAALPLGLGLAFAVHGRRKWAWLATGTLLVSMLLVGPGQRVDWPEAWPADGPVVDLVPRGASEPAVAARQQAQADRVMVARWRAGVSTSLAPSTPLPDPLIQHSELAAGMWHAPRPVLPCPSSEVGRLHALGFRSVVLHDPDRLDTVRALLGDGSAEDGLWTWALDSTGIPPSGCP